MKEQAIGFWNIFKQNKKGLFGVGLIIFFIIFAYFGPLLSDNDPINDWDVGGRRVPPEWFRRLPGYSHLVPNLSPIDDPGFIIHSDLSEWSFQETGSFTVTHFETGNDDGTEQGSMKITVNQDSDTGSIIISKIFQWPYDSSPKRFSGDIWYKTENMGDAEINLAYFLVDSLGNQYDLWQTTITSDKDWTEPEYQIDSYSVRIKQLFPEGVLADPAKKIFNTSGEYELNVVATYSGLSQSLNPVLYIDDLNLVLKGTCYGLLGTDQWGRDVYSQLAHGAKISLYVGLMSAIISVSIGLVVGLFAGFMGGLVDEISMRFADMLLVIPTLPLLLVLIAILGQSITNIILVISLLGWMGFSRTVRSQVLSLKERAFIEAARAAGGSTVHITIKHILPNVMSLVYVSLATSVPGAITAEASLSFLGLGDPSIMSWGQMLHDIVYYAAIKELYWVVPPGLCIALLAVSFVMIGFSLDEILNPQLRRR